MKYFISGGAGFIGSTLAHKLLKREPDAKIVIYDNLSNGRLKYITDLNSNPNVEFVLGDIKDLKYLTIAMRDCDVVYHFASNADISKAMTDPTIDFWEGTYLTQNILEAMRVNGIKKIIYASGSGVYGDYGYIRIPENTHFKPVTSTYGASKLAGESLMYAYSNMFDIEVRTYRFANVVGGNQTHGIVSDLIDKLIKNPNELHVLGNWEQLKSYVYVDDILEGIFLTQNIGKKIEIYNISYETSVSVKEIVEIVLEEAGVKGLTIVEYGDTPGGWKGDIPVVLLDSFKIKQAGWQPKYSSKEAIRKTAREILEK
jgi:UDP-glucose 4-epimerase